MAQYTVTAGCGHTTPVQLYGPGKERERRLDWMRSASGQCNACYAASKRAEEVTRADTDAQRMAEQIKAQAEREGVSVADLITRTGIREQLAANPDSPRAQTVGRALTILGA